MKKYLNTPLLLLSLLIVVVFFSSCKKAKLEKEWKEKQGMFFAAHGDTLYLNDTLRFNQIDINPDGMTLTGIDNRSYQFSVFKSNELAGEFDYYCEYSRMLFFTASVDGFFNQSYPNPALNSNINYYIRFSEDDSKIHFFVVANEEREFLLSK